MIQQGSVPSKAALLAAGALSCYFNGSQYTITQLSDLNTASLPAAITTDPAAPITQVSAGLTFPPKFFGVHAKLPASLPGLAAAGAGGIRLRDCGCNWGYASPLANTSGVTASTATSAITWNGHGLSAALNMVYLASTGGSIPGGLTGRPYYLVNVTANTFQLALTPGGAPISLTNAGSGTIACYSLLRSVCDPIAGTGTLDLIYAAAVAAGMDIIYDCTIVPQWASQDGTYFNRCTGQTDLLRWLGFLHNYYPAIGFFEAWNEPNTPGYFRGTTTGSGNDLYTYCGWLFDSLAYIGGGAKVISPSWNLLGGAALAQTWLTGSSGGQQKCDIIGAHVYKGSAYLAPDFAAIDAWAAVPAAVAASTSTVAKPLWITEVGESLVDLVNICRVHVYAAARGVARVYWYDYDIGAGMGQMQITATPGADAAYRGMISQCAGKAVGYVNRASSGQIGASVGGATILY